MPVFIKVSQNKITDSKSYGKWYGRVVSSKTMTYQELCKHMSEHNSVYGEDVCLGVANKLQNCMLEQLLEGKKVQFGELGVFYLSVKSTGADEEENFNLGVNINGLYLCFAPSRTDVNNLSSKMLKKKASFMNVKDLSLRPRPRSLLPPILPQVAILPLLILHLLILRLLIPLQAVITPAAVTRAAVTQAAMTTVVAMTTIPMHNN